MVPLADIGEVVAGADLAELVASAGRAAGGLRDGDVVVVASKVVSKAEDRLVHEDDRIEVARAEARRILRDRGELIISETHHGLVCANSGVDASNVPTGTVALLPRDPDLSARRIRAGLAHLASVDVGVIVSDTFGRPWRVGLTNVAIGVAGIEPFVDYRGQQDMQGRDLSATIICIADEIAGAAEMVMGKSSGVCAALVRGVPATRGHGAAADIVRPPVEDLFR